MDYISEKVESLGLNNAKGYSSPLNGYHSILPAEADEQKADDSAYPSAIVSLGYASNSTRPEICFATSQLAKFNSCPYVRHWNGVCRVYRYLNQTREKCITYNFGPSSIKLNKRVMAKMFSDSEFASDVISRRSVSGFILFIGSGPVCWQSKRQKSIATSTMEAEYIALFEAAKQVIWVTRLLRELQVADELTGPDGMKVYTDNQSALALTNETNSTKAKHIDVAYHLTRRCVKIGTSPFPISK